MSIYEKMPTDILDQFYTMIRNEIQSGNLSKMMYYEIALILEAGAKRGLQYVSPSDLYEVIDKRVLDRLKVSCK